MSSRRLTFTGTHELGDLLVRAGVDKNVIRVVVSEEVGRDRVVEGLETVVLQVEVKRGVGVSTFNVPRYEFTGATSSGSRS